VPAKQLIVAPTRLLLKATVYRLLHEDPFPLAISAIVEYSVGGAEGIKAIVFRSGRIP
jgi:hypothetical protein